MIKNFMICIVTVLLTISITIPSMAKGSKWGLEKKGNSQKADKANKGEGTNHQQDMPPQYFKSENQVSVISHSGVIKGAIVCGDDSIVGALVYIPGRSFMVKTDLDGNFEISYVPNGVYDLYVEAFGENPIIIPDVEVFKKAVTNIGDIEKCDDNDGDGFNSLMDCDDSDPNVNPDATEICDDGIDNDCDGFIDELDAEGCCTDSDGDGFFAIDSCEIGDDCDDSDPNVNPDATEICDDGIDNDCDGLIDDIDNDCNPS